MSAQPQNTSAAQTGDGKKLSMAQKLSGKYMTFRLGNEAYGVEILKVRELIGLMDITRVAKTRDYIRGVINLRGKIIPVVDLGMKFGMGRIKDTEQTVIIVLQYSVDGHDCTMGILVDEVLEVANIAEDNIEPPPNFGVSSDEDFILGIGKKDRKVIFLLDVNKALSAGKTRGEHDVLDF